MVERNRRRFWIGAALVGLLGIYLALDSRLVEGEDAYAAVGRSIEEYTETLKLLTTSYYKPLSADSLTSSAIEGMLGELDPYTQFLNRRAFEELMIDTSGKFGGLGITISTLQQDSVRLPVVMSVIEGTPADTAGLVVGDRIVAVEGDSTAGKQLQEVVDVLRGRPGTRVVITIDRPGRPALFEQQIIRARITVKSMEFVEEIEPGIGYISMSGLVNSRFSETTPDELAEAIERIKARNVQGIILDLRGNPGGLLTQAVAVADMFLDPGLLVVTTRGRVSSQNQEYHTKGPSRVKDTPLVVLVNGHSASASEIVAGAIQDSDRGLILGTPTFGKGSVQSFRQIGRDKALKWTTALYYTPSGRSIHKSYKPFRRSGDLGVAVGSKLVPFFQAAATIAGAESREDAITELFEQFDLDDLGQAEQLFETDLGQLLGKGLRNGENDPQGEDPDKKYKTAGGRTVYGGGGITPDVKVRPVQQPRLVIEMRRAGIFFDFAVEYASTRTFPGQPEGFSVDDGVMAAFRTFLADSTNLKGFAEYRTPGTHRLEEMEQALEEAGLRDEVSGELARLREVVKKEREAEFEEAEPFIRLEIERELANRLWGTRGRMLASLKGDKQFQEAVRILKDPERYRQSMKLALAEK